MTVIHVEKGETEIECITKIQEKHSLNYQIISKRAIKIKTGFFNLFETDGIEISYVLTRLPSVLSGRDLRTLNNSPLSETKSTKLDFDEEKRKILENSNYKQSIELQEVLENVKAMRDELVSTKSSITEEHPTITKIESWLEENEFSVTYIRKIIDKLRKNFSLDELEDFEKVQNAVVEWIGETIKIKTPDYSLKPQIILLVGPTGVGKTTTVAKLAARFAFGQDGNKQKKSVRIITIDWYRIAAKEQIEIYAKTMRIPMVLAESNNDLVKALDDYSTGVDYIIIDTTGYSPKDYKNIAKMKSTLDIRNFPVETYLCMSASTKASDMKDIMQQYEIFGYSSLIITKFDETNHIGNIICAANDKNKPISYLTTGQIVPRYFENASVMMFLCNLNQFKIDRKSLEEKFGEMKNS